MSTVFAEIRVDNNTIKLQQMYYIRCLAKVTELIPLHKHHYYGRHYYIINFLYVAAILNMSCILARPQLSMLMSYWALLEFAQVLWIKWTVLTTLHLFQL